MSSGSPKASGERRVLDEAGGARAMTGVLGVMLFLLVLAAAAGLATANAKRALDRQLAGRLTVQIVDGEPARRDAAAARVLRRLRDLPQVRQATAVDRAALARLLQPWLGSEAGDAELPVPALIDVDLTDAGDAAVARVTAAARATSPAARVDRHEAWMSPVGNFMRSIGWLAAALVVLMAAASAAVVMLAARAGLETHRGTVEVMHMLGSTDVQVARLFQRRLALDAAVGGGAGAVAALAIVWLIGAQGAGLGSELLGNASLSSRDWIVLALVPVLFVGLATLAARATVVRLLRRTL